mmetsp:Transcript_42149/g.136411  ORF Transcript_42149/g.136411 Transcript_42149/m.136411 type:complete len:200 (-) Transcript_42149:1476-2075(-)
MHGVHLKAQPHQAAAPPRRLLLSCPQLGGEADGRVAHEGTELRGDLAVSGAPPPQRGGRERGLLASRDLQPLPEVLPEGLDALEHGVRIQASARGGGDVADELGQLLIHVIHRVEGRWQLQWHARLLRGREQEAQIANRQTPSERKPQPPLSLAVATPLAGRQEHAVRERVDKRASDEGLRHPSCSLRRRRLRDPLEGP